MDDTKTGQTQDDTIVHFDLTSGEEKEGNSPTLSVHMSEEESPEEEPIIPAFEPEAFAAKNGESYAFDPSSMRAENTYQGVSGGNRFSLMGVGDDTDVESLLDNLERAVEKLKSDRIEMKKQHEANIRAKEEEISQERERMESDDRMYEERVNSATKRLDGIHDKLAGNKSNVIPLKTKEKKESTPIEMKKAA